MTANAQHPNQTPNSHLEAIIILENHISCTLEIYYCQNVCSTGSSHTTMARTSTNYLIAYNFMSALLWFAVLGRVILLIPLAGFENVYGGVGQFVKWTQTLAFLEVLHSAVGLSSSWQSMAGSCFPNNQVYSLLGDLTAEQC